MHPGNHLSHALSILTSAAERIRSIEHEAGEALFSRDDPKTYRQKLQEKTILLMELPEMLAPCCEGMPEDMRAEIETNLNAFAMRAEQALELSSIFYMSALLYPETYQEGDMNDLESFIHQLREKYQS